MHARWERGDGQALKISDFLATSTFKKKEIYNEFYQPMRIPFTMGVALPIRSSMSRQLSDSPAVIQRAGDWQTGVMPLESSRRVSLYS